MARGHSRLVRLLSYSQRELGRSPLGQHAVREDRLARNSATLANSFDNVRRGLLAEEEVHAVSVRGARDWALGHRDP